MCGKTFVNVLAALAPPLRGGRHPKGAPFTNLLLKNHYSFTFLNASDNFSQNISFVRNSLLENLCFPEDRGCSKNIKNTKFATFYSTSIGSILKPIPKTIFQTTTFSFHPSMHCFQNAWNTTLINLYRSVYGKRENNNNDKH
jgi:hypothetical protein